MGRECIITAMPAEVHYGGGSEADRKRIPCRSPATKKGRCRLHRGASGSGGPAGERNGQYRHGERTKAAIAEQRKFSALPENALRRPDLKSRTAFLT
jgi:glucans biosynthesis protein